jgi:hypothetical protein
LGIKTIATDAALLELAAATSDRQRACLRDFLLLIPLVLSACASIPVDTSAPQLEVRFGEALSERVGGTRIVFVRNKSFAASAIHYWPTVNGDVVAGLLTGDYVELYSSTEVETVGAWCVRGWSSPWKHRQVDLSDSSATEFYFRLSPSMTELDQCVDVERLDKDDVLSSMNSYRRVHLGGTARR